MRDHAAPEFDFVAGCLCLDLANTENQLPSGSAGEDLFAYFDLVAWGRAAGVISALRGEVLREEARRRPTQAAAVFVRALRLRGAIFRVFSTVTEENEPSPRDIAVLNRELAKAMAQSCLALTPDGFSWGWENQEFALDQVLWPVVRSAAELLTSLDVSKVRQCGSPRCAYLFVDGSKNHRRRWCDMKVCGNRAKARRHRERRKSTP